MKFGFRVPSFKKRIAARTSWKRVARHSLGLKAPRGMGWVTNPRKAAYNRVYNRTTVGVDSLFAGSSRRSRGSSASAGASGCIGVLVLLVLFGGGFGMLLAGLLPFAIAAAGFGIVTVFLKSKQNKNRQFAEARTRELQAAAEAERQAAAAAALASRRLDLLNRFGPEVTERILAGQYWTGATAEVLVESLGQPAHIRERVLKTKTKQTYCYHPIGKNRFALRIHLEDGRVTGWEGQ